MDSFIDLHSNLTYTEAQINKMILSIRRETYPDIKNDYLNQVILNSAIVTGTGAGAPVREPTKSMIAAFRTFYEELLTLHDDVIIDNQLLMDTIAYEDALDRLNQYVLADGRPAYSEYLWEGTYTQPVDEDGEPVGDPIPDCILIEHLAIEPLNPTVPSYDEGGNPIGIPNTLITQDYDERLKAQGIIDTVTAEVISLAVAREPEPTINPCS